MNRNSTVLIRIVGQFCLVMSAVCSLLFLANLRSRIYYHGPNYSFILWLCLYCGLTGLGLLRLKKWSVMMLFVPGICAIAIFVYAWAKGASASMPWALLNYAFLVVLFAIPAAMIKKWNELHW